MFQSFVFACLLVSYTSYRWVFNQTGGTFQVPSHGGVQGAWIERFESFFNEPKKQEDWHNWYRMPMLISETTLFIRFSAKKDSFMIFMRFWAHKGQTGLSLFWFSPCKVHSYCISC